MKQRLKFRTAPVTRGWNSKARFYQKGYEKQYGDTEKTFVEDLLKASVAIVNTNSTTILESLSLNIPTLMIFDYSVWLPNDLAIDDFLSLQEKGILYESPKAAAQWLNENFDSLDIWWNETSRQETISNFVQKYALSDKEYVKNWKQFIDSI